MISIHCISLQSKRSIRFQKIIPFYSDKNLNLIEEKAIEGSNKNYIDNLKRDLKIEFDNKASYGNQALFLKSYMLWYKFYQESNDDYFIIIEDDVIPEKNVIRKFNDVLKELPKDFDICLMTGVNMSEPTTYSKLLFKKVAFSCIGAYVISKTGAKKLVDAANNNLVETCSGGGVLDYWVCQQELNFYKTKENLFNVYNLPSSLASSRNKIIERYFYNIDRYLTNNYLFTYHFEINRDSIIPFQVNGNITITYYLFFNLFIKYLFYFLIGNKLITISLIFGINILDSYNYIYLLEELINKFLEIILSSSIFCIFV
jgi:GR25 family glycosyltransferase involved in LPS biosynthesis